MQFLEFDNREDFISLVLDKTKGKDTIVLGGHYLLAYNNAKKKLEPSFLNENKDIILNNGSEKYLGSFPLESFDLGLNIVIQKKRNNEKAKISVLVNDHLFQSKSSKELNVRLEDMDWGMIKEEYYNNSELPKAYREKINDYGMTVENVILMNQNKRSKYFNPMLFSETSLRKKFDKKLKKELSKNDSFFLIKHKNAKSELFFVDNKENSLCLTNGGVCGCSGEVMQFLYEIQEMNYEALVLIVPLDCFDSVRVGVEAYICYNKEAFTNKKLHNFIVATGIGESDNIECKSKESIQTIQFFG